MSNSRNSIADPFHHYTHQTLVNDVASPLLPVIGEGETHGVLDVADEAVRRSEGGVIRHEVGVHGAGSQPLQ